MEQKYRRAHVVADGLLHIGQQPQDLFVLFDGICDCFSHWLGFDLQLVATSLIVRKNIIIVDEMEVMTSVPNIVQKKKV